MKELYNAVLRAIQKQDPNEKSCYNCIVHFIKAELNKLGFYDYYNGSSCSNVLFYLEDLGIIKIISGGNRISGIDCFKLEIKAIHNYKYNKI